MKIKKIATRRVLRRTRPGPSAKVVIRKLPAGVRGLDEIMGGGIPEFSFNIIAGAPGCGKTTLAHQIVFANATVKKPALYFTVLGEPALKMLRYQQQYSFFDETKLGRAIRFINLSDMVAEQDLNAVMEEIIKQVRSINPGVVVVDSFRTVVRQATGAHEGEMPAFIQRLAQFLTSWEATTFLIGEYVPEEIRDNPVFTVADGLLWLSQLTERNSVVRKLQIYKLRGQASVPGLHTFRIDDTGLRAFPRTLGSSPGKLNPARLGQRLSTGIAELDTMMNGGLLPGDSLLVAGPSGTGKSALATQFIAEGLRRGETAVMALFEERPQQYTARADSLGLHLKTPFEKGRLEMLYLRPLDLSVDEITQEILDAVKRVGAKRLVIDSLVGFEMALAPGFREDFRESLYRMIVALTGAGVTVLTTVEVEDNFTSLQFSHYAISFLTDDIIRLRYVEIDGQLRKVMVVIKMRGGNHSKDIREYVITDKGVVVILPRRTDYNGLITGIPTRTGPRSAQADEAAPETEGDEVIVPSNIPTMPTKILFIPAYQTLDLSQSWLATVEHSPLPTIMVEGAPHTVRQMNTAGCHLLEKSGIECIGKKFGDLLPEQIHWLETLDRVYHTGQPESHTEEQVFTRPTVFWTYTMWPVKVLEQPVGVMIQIVVTTKQQRQTVAMNEALVLGSVHQHELTEAADRLNVLLREEIAERTKAQQALAEKARLLDLSNDAIVVLDCEHRIQYWNRGAVELYGWSREEALGKVSYELLRTDFLRPIEEITGELNRTNRWTGELTHTKRDGGRIAVLVRKVMDRDGQGNAVAILEYMTDITGRKQAEELLRVSEERYRSLFNSIDEGFCIIEMLFDENALPVDYRFLETNPAFEKQSGLHGAPGKRMLELSPGHEAHWFHVYGAVAMTGESVRFESEAKALNRWFDVYAFRIDKPEDRKVAVIFTDISDRKRSEEILRESREKIRNYAGDLEKVVRVRTEELTASNQQLEAIVYSMAHDLRAPLRAMQGFSSLLVDEASTALSESGRDYAHRIDQSAQFMDALLSDLLAYTRTSQQHIELTMLSLEKVVGSVLSRMQKEISSVNACVECSGPWPEVRAHEPTLTQVLSNLTSNALKFVRPGVTPLVRIRAEEQAESIRVWVEDNGLGISPEYQNQIFRLFIRLDRGKYPGTGAGLAIVQKGIERMGGRVGVESTFGQGSRFWIELPKAGPTERGPHHVD